MNDHSMDMQLRYLKEVCFSLQRKGFGTQPLEGSQLPIEWNDTPLCRITGKGSILYRREDVSTPQSENALNHVEDIAAQVLEYMTAMETAPQLKASGLDENFLILADFNGTVLAGSYSQRGVQFVTWNWDHDHMGVSHGHYFTENYDGAKKDFAVRSGLIPKQEIFQEEHLIEIYRCCTDTLQGSFELSYSQEKTIQDVCEQIKQLLPDIMERIQQQDAEPTQEQTM